jgi:carboxypeptidase family protein/PDZ domain-containing protein
MANAPTAHRQARRIERAASWLATIACLLWVVGLRDAPTAWLPQNGAPPLPASVGDRDAALVAIVVDQDGTPAEDTLVRVFTIVGDAVYLAQSGVTGPDGRVRLTDLPRGETWVVAEKDGRARITSRLVLETGERELRLQLEQAQTFEVVVVDPLQRPIRGVDVTLYGADPLPFHVTTDARGLARFASLGPPRWTVEVTAAGFDGKLIADLGPEDSPLFVKLERLASLVVTVVEQNGTPAAGATVLLAGSSLWPARSAVTDTAGRVTIGGLERGFYDVHAERGELTSDTETGVLVDYGEDKEVTLTLLPGTFVKVIVTDGPGDDAPPVAGADVALVEGGLSSFPHYGRSDKKGVAMLGPITGDGAVVSAVAEGFVPTSAVPVEPGQNEVHVALLRGGTIVGHVVDDRDFGIEGAELEVVGSDLEGMPIVESSALVSFRADHFAFALPGALPLVPMGELGVMPVVPDIPRDGAQLIVPTMSRGGTPWTSGRDGGFRLHPVTPGHVRVVARHPGYVEGMSEAIDLAPGGEAEVTVVLHEGAILEGRVMEKDHTPARGARIEVLATVGSLVRITYTADDGTFAFAALPDEVVLQVARAGALDQMVEHLRLELTPGERHEIEIVLDEPREPITLRVSDERGYPLDRVEIHAASLDPVVAITATLFTDESGEAHLQGVRGLPLRVTASRRGHAPAVVELDGAPATVEIALDPALTAVGTVEARHRPIEGAEVTLLTSSDTMRARTDADGAFRFEDLALGEVRLLAIAKGYVPHETEVTIAGSPRRDVALGRIELAEGGTVTGTVVDERGDPIAGVYVAGGRVPTYLPLGPLPPGMAITDRQGRFTLVDLEAGPTVVEAYKTGRGRADVDVEVRAGKSRDNLKIELQPDPEADAAVIDAPASLAVTLGEAIDGKRRVLVFEHVPIGGEAQHAGVFSGDRLLACNGATMRSLEQARRCLSGPLGEDLVLELARDPDMRWRVRVPRERLRR